MRTSEDLQIGAPCEGAQASDDDTLAFRSGESAGLDIAHKLAGSLGMYGYDEGTRVARELELLLEGAAPDAERLRELAARLRRAVFPAG